MSAAKTVINRCDGQDRLDLFGVGAGRRAVFDADPQQFQSGGLSQWFRRMFFREHWMRERGDDPGKQ